MNDNNILVVVLAGGQYKRFGWNWTNIEKL